MKRKICVITGTRAEYGILNPLLEEIKLDNQLQLQLAVTGMHLSTEFGLTYKDIINDGFIIDEKVEMILSSDTAVGITKSIGLGIIGFADALDRLKPDLVVLLGDRYEILAAAQAAMIAKIPIAHIHGGEASEGLYDDAIRHAITKMSHLHFVSAAYYAQRVIQMGENPECVFNLGALATDNISKLQFNSRANFLDSLHFDVNDKFFLIAYHPETLLNNTSKQNFQNLLQALDSFPDYKIIFTGTNSDSDGRIINQLISEYVKENSLRAISFVSMGKERFLNAILHSECMIGNSSSGMIEAPIMKKTSINIGIRQQGRIRFPSVIDATSDIHSIIQAIQQAQSIQHKQSLQKMHHPFGSPGVAKRMTTILKNRDTENLIIKKFKESSVCS